MNPLKSKFEIGLIFFFLLMISFQSTAGPGGPDAFGYTWIDSDEPMGPTFSWVDLTPTPGAIQILKMGNWFQFSRVRVHSGLQRSSWPFVI